MSAPRLARIDDAAAIARLHAAGVAEGFLVTLGPAFLRRLYARVVRSQHAFALVVDDETDDHRAPCGFIAVAEDTGAFYRDFILRDGLLAGAVAIPQVVRAPRHVWETFRYGTRRVDDDAPRAEILAVAVDARARGGGRGGVLAAAAVAELGRRGITSARVVTATGNIAAIKTYELAGFRRDGKDSVHRGVTQEVMVWP